MVAGAYKACCRRLYAAMRCQNRASLDGMAGLVTVAVLDSPPSALRLNIHMNEYGECNANIIV